MQQGKHIQGNRCPTRQKPYSRKEHKLNRIMIQLTISALLFLVVFVGGKLIPDRVCDVFAQVGQTIRSESDLVDCVQNLGDAIAEGKNLGSAVREWCVETFLPSKIEDSTEISLDQHLDGSAQFRSHLLPELAVDAG